MNKLQQPSECEVLERAIALEAENARQFEEWGNRFLTYSAELSSLLEQMSQENKQHQRLLEKIYARFFTKLSLRTDRPGSQEATEEFPELQQHFFIVDPETALQML